MDANFVVIGDSHISGLSTFFTSHGFVWFSIHGGGLDHVREMIAGHDLPDNPSCLVIWSGGNDLSHSTANASGVLNKLSVVIRMASRKWPKCVLVTGGVIPRFMPDPSATGKFMANVFRVDEMVMQHGELHHHFATDIAMEDNTRPLMSFYKRDGVHLSPFGTVNYHSALDWVVTGINLGTFQGSFKMGPRDKENRVCFWRF